MFRKPFDAREPRSAVAPGRIVGARSGRRATHAPEERPPVVLALLAGRVAAARLRDQLGSDYDVVVTSDSAAVPTLVSSRRPRALVCGWTDGLRQAALATVRLVGRRWPWLPVIGYLSAGLSSTHELLALLRAGVSAFAFEEADDVRSHVRHAIVNAEDRVLAVRVRDCLSGTLAPHALELLEFCLAEGGREPTVAMVASALGVHRKTLASWLRREGAPPPAELIAWSRVIRAAAALSTSTRPADHIAMELAFASGPAMRNLLRRRLGRCPTELRAPGGLDVALEAFRAYCRLMPCRQCESRESESSGVTERERARKHVAAEYRAAAARGEV